MDTPIYTPPTIRFREVNFSDGTSCDLDLDEIVVIVGPNNAGKSLALRELEGWIGGRRNTMTIKHAEIESNGTSKDFEEYIHTHTKVTVNGDSISIEGPGFGLGIGGQDLKSMWPHDLSLFAPLFCTRVATETRITESDPAPSFAALSAAPAHPIHLLYNNDGLEQEISRYFSKAFGEDLIVFRLGGSEIPLLVGKSPSLNTDEDRLSNTYNARLKASALPLIDQGDGMRSFASVTLRLLAPTTPSVLLLDEPEAFLHPPQARLLGEIIATNKPQKSQLFVATHSPDVLSGLISNAPQRMRLLRMQRIGTENKVLELDKQLLREVSNDPLMMQSSVMSGIFHERVIVCESDSDCMFYRSVLNVPEIHQGRYPDVLFIHGNGKHRMATLSKLLVQLGVNVDVIADIDILKDLGDLEGIVNALKGNWSDFEDLANKVQKSIEMQQTSLTGKDVKKAIQEVLSQTPESGSFPSGDRSRIQELLRKSSPWDLIKKAGIAALPSGDTRVRFDELDELCKSVGLWMVRVGEAEGFRRTISGHGPKWVQRVLKERNFVHDEELGDARLFVSELWSSRL